jgi:hypothetical protein
MASVTYGEIAAPADDELQAARRAEVEAEAALPELSQRLAVPVWVA